MKPQRFEIGQPVTPKRGEDWSGKNNNEIFPLPEGEIYHIKSYSWFGDFAEWAVCLIEIPGRSCFMEYHFEPVITSAELTELLKEEPLTVEVDLRDVVDFGIIKG